MNVHTTQHAIHYDRVKIDSGAEGEMHRNGNDPYRRVMTAEAWQSSSPLHETRKRLAPESEMPQGSRVAIVTGAGGPLGAEIARRLLGRGFAIAAADLRLSWCETALGELTTDDTHLKFFGADLRYMHEAEAMVLSIAESMGPPEVVVNAPFPGRRDVVLSMTEWESIVYARLRAPLLVSRAAERHLAASGAGRIVNVLQTDVSGPHRPDDLVAWEALRAMTETLSTELGLRGVAVNTVAIETDCPTASAESRQECCVTAEAMTASRVEFLVSDVDDVSGQMIRFTHPAQQSAPGRGPGR